MRVRRSGLLWLLAGCGPLLLGCFVALAWWGRHLEHPFSADSFENTWINVVLGSMLPPLGALVLSRVPRHPLGWVFLTTGLASATTMATYPYADLGVSRGWTGAHAAAWVSEWVWGLGFIPLVTLGVLLFPDGRPPGRRWRLLLAGDVAAVVLVPLANAFRPGRMQNGDTLVNPLGVPLPDAVFGATMTVGMGLFFVGFVGGAASAVVRWRRSHGAERAQVSWFAAAAALMAAGLLLPLRGGLNDVVVVVTVPLLPIAIAVAILRRRLYGIEVAVRRSLVYGAVTAILLLVYSAVVTFLGTLVSRGPTATLVATSLVAIAFAPVRTRVQRSVDRLLYGDRRDPYKVLSGLGRKLEAADATPLVEAAATIATSLRLPYVRIEADGDVPLVAEDGAPLEDVHVVTLVFRGEQVGRLVVAPRSPRDPFRPADLRLLDDLGRQLGVTAHATQLAAALQRSREGLVTAREEERRRIRRDLHDGLGPALAGVALGLDAVARLAVEEPERATTLAGQLKSEVQASLADVRRLVEDLRPPALDQLGLVGAVRQQARLLTERDPGLDVSVEASGLTELPAALEVAAYRITTEALRNVSQHASARHCRVCLSLKGAGLLHLEIEDDGVGMSAQRRIGVGLSAMNERAAELGGTCVTGAAALGGTRVTALLPVVPR